MELFSECFPTLADAIGYTARDEVRVVDWARTAAPDIADQGFRRTVYALDAEGLQWTVFFDPAREVYTGAHPFFRQFPVGGPARKVSDPRTAGT